MNSLYSNFDTSLIKEYETLDLEQKLLTGINIQFSYYPIVSREIQRKPGMIYSIYRGNTTQPNVILNDKNYFPTYYQTSELCIYGNRLHEGPHSAELIVKHEPVSSSVSPLYVCFFLYKNVPPSSSPAPSSPTSPTIENSYIESFGSPASQLKLIIESKESVEIDLSSFLRPYQVLINKTQTSDLPVNWKLYKSTTRENGKPCFVVLIENPIWIDSLTFDKIPNDKKAVSPFITYNDSIFSNNINEIINKKRFNYKEGFVQVTGSGNNETGYALDNNSNNQMVCEVIDDNIHENQEINFYQVPVDGKNNKSQEKMNSLLAGLYLVLGSMIIVATMLLSPKLFDTLLNIDFVKIKIGNYPKAFLMFLTIFVFAIGGGCIFYAFFATKPIDTMLIIIGVTICIYSMLAFVGTLTMSQVILDFEKKEKLLGSIAAPPVSSRRDSTKESTASTTSTTTR